jgi:hypothetical protein
MKHHGYEVVLAFARGADPRRRFPRMLRLVLALILGSAPCLFAQGFVRPGQLPPKSQWPAELVDHFGYAGDVLVSALARRVGSITNFQFPQVTVAWNFSILRMDEDTFIMSYTPPSGLTFYVQALVCSKKDALIDSTILGPTETASDFYDANLNFLLSNSDDDSSNYVTCGGEAHLLGAISSQTTEIPGTDYVTSQDRAIRHLCGWVQYFTSEKGKNPQRAADFLVTALDKEKAHLLALESDKSYSELVGALSLFDKQFPADGFDRALLVEPDAKAHVRSYFETTIRIRGKLKPFIPNAEARISKDGALLAMFR